MHSGSGPHEPHEAYAADALAHLVRRTAGETPVANGKPAKSTVANVHVVIDHGALVRGNALEGEQCEIPVHLRTAMIVGGRECVVVRR